MMRTAFYITVFFLLTLFSLNATAQQIWRENSFNDFIDGTFDDAGANMYVSRQGNIEMINRWDVNNDGYIDILCVNSHPLVEMLDLSIYWGNGKDYSIRNHSYVPANGPMWITPADLNGDNAVDLVVANYSNGTWTEMNSFVYYGGLQKNAAASDPKEWAFYPFKSRIELPGSNTQKAAVADINNDGYKDIIFAFSGGFWEYRDKTKEGSSPSRIYWGSSAGFDSSRFSNIWTKGATDIVAADLNGDNWKDLVFANGDGNMSYIYYGGKNGLRDEPDVSLPTDAAQAVTCGDINNDGMSDIVFACESGQRSFGYLNVDGKFSADIKIEFETFTAKDVVIEDFNKDGFSDVFFTNHQFSLTGDPNLANRLIYSYLYYGSAEGFLKERRASIPTIGAWGANAADLNSDGWTDLLICNFQEHYSYEVPSFVYWNSPEGFSQNRRTPLYEHGAQGNAIADFNGDGFLDIIIASMMGNSRGDYDDSFLYFGNVSGNYSVNNRIELPGREAYEQAFADLDDDGQVDILLQNRGETTRLANELWIYWNEHNQFSTWRMSGLPSYAGLGVEVADLDRDGFLDIIISNGAPVADPIQGNARIASYIYWGSQEGWPVTDRSFLPIVQTRSPAVCDINHDGFLDLVFGQQGKWGNASIFFGNGTRNFNEDQRYRITGSTGSGSPGVADLNKDGLLDIAFAHDKNVLVYYQISGREFGLSDVQKIPVQAKTMCVADVNSDGWVDLLCPYYKGDGRRSWYSTILLGSEAGYNISNSIKLPTDGGTGSLVSDFNHDGFTDVFFFCHRSDGSYDETGVFGDHHTNSLLYWGAASGFSADNRLKIPSIGAHYDTGIDIGHIRDRGFIYEYISSPFRSNGKKPIAIKWQADMPYKSTVTFQIRTAPSEGMLQNAVWMGEKGPNTYISRPSKLNNITGDIWMQYKAVFDTDNGAYSPVLKSVEITLD